MNTATAQCTHHVAERIYDAEHRFVGCYKCLPPLTYRATAKQLGRIRDLCRAAGLDADAECGKPQGQMTKREAAAVIERLGARR